MKVCSYRNLGIFFQFKRINTLLEAALTPGPMSIEYKKVV